MSPEGTGRMEGRGEGNGHDGRLAEQGKGDGLAPRATKLFRFPMQPSRCCIAPRVLRVHVCVQALPLGPPPMSAAAHRGLGGTTPCLAVRGSWQAGWWRHQPWGSCSAGPRGGKGYISRSLPRALSNVGLGACDIACNMHAMPGGVSWNRPPQLHCQLLQAACRRPVPAHS